MTKFDNIVNHYSVVKILFGLFFSVLAGCCIGQSFTTINYAIPEGLPSSEVYEVFQDKKGFLWFATDNGVARYDGHDMEVYHMEHGLSDPAVFGFHEDDRGRLWFRTYSGKLSYFEEGKIYQYQHNDKLTRLVSKDLILSIYCDSLDQLWFLTNGITGKIDSVGNTVTQSISNEGIFYKRVGKGVLCGIGSLANSIGSIRIDGRIFPLTPPEKGLLGNSLVCSLKMNNRILLSYAYNVFEYDGHSVRKVLTAPAKIISLSRDSHDRIWVGYFNNGAERYDSTLTSRPWVPDFLNGISVTKVLEDHESGIWITTLEKGVFYIPNFLIENNRLPTSAKIRSVAATDHHVFIGDQQGTVQALDKETYARVWKKSVPGTQVIALLADQRKNLWISGFHFTSIIDPWFNETIISKVGKHTKMPENTVRSAYIAYLSNFSDSIIWGMTAQTLFKYNIHGDLQYAKKIKNLCRVMLVDNSVIFVADRTGLNLYDHNFNFLKELTEFRDFKISNILKLNDSTFAVTTIGNGFILLNKNKWRINHYYVQNKFISNYVYTAAKIDNSLWLGTEKGVIEISIGSLLNDNPTYKLLTKRSGLMSDKINFLLYAEPDVWAFSDEGFSVFKKDMLRTIVDKPLFYIKEILVNKAPIKLGKEETLPFNKNNIQLSFGFVAFKNQNIFTRYRLDESASWNYNNIRKLEFYSLAPGDYRLELQYSTDNTHWAPAYTSPTITIQPALWQTWYFQTLVAFAILLVISLYVATRIRTYKRYQEKLIQSEIETIEHERSRIAKELHDSVGTDLTAIKMVVSQRLKKIDDPKTEEVETQFQNTIQGIKNIIYDLAPPGLERYGLMAGLKNYVGKLNGSIPIKIEFNCFGPEVKGHELNVAVFRVIQELISNSLKHSNAEKITLHVNAFEKLLNIVYEDNGQGFTWDENHKGLGLYNIETRVQSLNGRLKFESSSFGISYSLDIPLTGNFKDVG